MATEQSNPMHRFPSPDADLLDSLREMVLCWRPDGVVHYANRRCRELLTTADSALVGERLPDALPMEFREEAARHCLAVLGRLRGDHRSHAGEWRVETPTGTRRIVWRDLGVFDATGTLVEIRSFGLEWTAWPPDQDTAATAREEETRWRFALEGLDQGLWDWDMATDKVYFSPGWKTMLGYADDEIGEHFDEWRRRVHPEDLPRALAALEGHVRGERALYEAQMRMLGKDGGWRWILARGKVMLRHADGTPARMIGTHADVTAHRDLEAKLRLAAAAFERTVEGVLTTDALGHITSVNRAFTAITGYGEEEVLGRTPRILRSGRHDDEFYRAMWDELT